MNLKAGHLHLLLGPHSVWSVQMDTLRQRMELERVCLVNQEHSLQFQHLFSAFLADLASSHPHMEPENARHALCIHFRMAAEMLRLAHCVKVDTTLHKLDLCHVKNVHLAPFLWVMEVVAFLVH